MNITQMDALRAGLFYEVIARDKSGRTTTRKMRYSHLDIAGRLVFHQRIRKMKSVYSSDHPDWIHVRIYPGMVVTCELSD
jgi:hypothetical protein